MLASLVVAIVLPLAGTTIVIDPGHQLGNHNFPQQIDAPVPSGGFTKPCNTTGTATNGGYAEATFASIHADGSHAAGARGFHVIAPADRAPWTDDIVAPSARLARAVRSGLQSQDFPVANYVARGEGSAPT